MHDNITLIKTNTPKENLFGGTTKPVNAFNSTKDFTSHSWEVSRESREASQNRIAAMLAQTKKELELTNEC